MLNDDPHILSVARRLKDVVEAPVLGGIAVFLHGYERTTKDLDFYTPDRNVTDRQLREAGAVWDVKNREHVLDSVRIHTVTPADAGHEVRKTSIIQGVRVVSLADLIAIKLRCGLNNHGRSKDIGDVEELVRVTGLDKSFAPKLPKDLRQDFKDLIDRVRHGEKQSRSGPKF
jgi:predicted nucleotidyltransferase component of viral defense system